MTRIKMCGFTRPDDARAAADCGADAIGVVFWAHSPRGVTLQQAAAIAAVVPPFVTLVGVFVDEPPETVGRVRRALGLGAVQLHGCEPVETWAAYPGPIIKAVGAGAGFDPSGLAAWPAGVVPLLDAADDVRKGGTGRTADWDVAAAAARLRPIVLAGGLVPDTVGAAIAAVRPAAVDVASGIEAEPGIKDAARMRAFVRAVRRADGREAA